MHTTAPCMQYLKKILKEPLSWLTKRSSMIKKRVLQNVNCVLSEQRRGFQRASVRWQAKPANLKLVPTAQRNLCPFKPHLKEWKLFHQPENYPKSLNKDLRIHRIRLSKFIMHIKTYLRSGPLKSRHRPEMACVEMGLFSQALPRLLID